MKQAIAIVLLFAAALPLTAGKKKPKGTMYRKADQKVEIAGAPASLGTADRKCENYAWAAIVETMMRAQQVPIKQDDWAMRSSGGMKCNPALDDYAQRAQSINGDYTLDGGKKVRIHADFGGMQPD